MARGLLISSARKLAFGQVHSCDLCFLPKTPEECSSLPPWRIQCLGLEWYTTSRAPSPPFLVSAHLNDKESMNNAPWWLAILLLLTLFNQIFLKRLSNSFSHRNLRWGLLAICSLWWQLQVQSRKDCAQLHCIPTKLPCWDMHTHTLDPRMVLASFIQHPCLEFVPNRAGSPQSFKKAESGRTQLCST